MTVVGRLRREAARRFAMGDVAGSTNSTSSPFLPTLVMTVDERSRHEAARRFALGDVMNAAPLPTLPRAATV